MSAAIIIESKSIPVSTCGFFAACERATGSCMDFTIESCSRTNGPFLTGYSISGVGAPSVVPVDQTCQLKPVRRNREIIMHENELTEVVCSVRMSIDSTPAMVAGDVKFAVFQYRRVPESSRPVSQNLHRRTRIAQPVSDNQYPKHGDYRTLNSSSTSSRFIPSGRNRSVSQ